jgi:pimeloyl-ACP methyl ester carboxylesterase
LAGHDDRVSVAALFLHMTTLAANGLELFVQEDGPEEAGGRTPVVMLHGCARNGNIWNGWIPTLSQKYQVLRPDIRGCGSSGDPGQDYVFEIDDMVSDLIEILDGLSLAEVHHIGESTGGIVGAIAAARYPERFRSLTLVSTPIAPANGNLEVKAPGASSPEEAFARLGLKHWWLQSRALTGDLFGDERDEVIATDFARTPLHVALSMWTAMHRPDVTIEPYLSRLTMPTLVLTPTASYTMTQEQQQTLVSALPNVRQLVYEAPHGMFYLRADELARDTLAFLEGVE